MFPEWSDLTFTVRAWSGTTGTSISWPFGCLESFKIIMKEKGSRLARSIAAWQILTPWDTITLKTQSVYASFVHDFHCTMKLSQFSKLLVISQFCNLNWKLKKEHRINFNTKMFSNFWPSKICFPIFEETFFKEHVNLFSNKFWKLVEWKKKINFRK